MTVRFTSWQHVGQWASQASWPEGLHGALDLNGIANASYATQRSNYGVAEGGGRCGVQRRFRSVKRSRELAAYGSEPRLAPIRHTRVFRGSHAIRDGRTVNGGMGL